MITTKELREHAAALLYFRKRHYGGNVLDSGHKRRLREAEQDL